MAVPKRKTTKSRSGKRRSHIRVSPRNIIEDKKSGNAYMGIIDTIKKIENKDWIKNRKSLSKQERYRNTLYRKLNRHTQELVEIDSAFKNTKLYERALDVYNKDD